MALDGFSTRNFSIQQEKTSSQLASEAESIAKKANRVVIKNVGGLSAKQRSAKKKMDDENYDPVYYVEKEDDILDEYISSALEEGHLEYDPENAKQKYNVKLNNKTQLIELIDTESGKIVETITPTDLIKVVSKLNSTLGILVNRKI